MPLFCFYGIAKLKIYGGGRKINKETESNYYFFGCFFQSCNSLQEFLLLRVKRNNFGKNLNIGLEEFLQIPQNLVG